MAVINSLIMAVFVGLFNFITMYYMDENTIRDFKNVLKAMLFFL